MGFETAVEDIEALEGAVGKAEHVLDVTDVLLEDGDKALQWGERALGRADDFVQRAEHDAAVGRRVLPKVAIGLALVGAGIVIAVAIRRSRAGQAAAREDVLEQHEQPSMADIADDEGEDAAADLADAADAVEE